MQQVDERELGQIPLRYWQPESDKRAVLLEMILERLTTMDDSLIEAVVDEILSTLED